MKQYVYPDRCMWCGKSHSLVRVMGETHEMTYFIVECQVCHGTKHFFMFEMDAEHFIKSLQEKEN